MHANMKAKWDVEWDQWAAKVAENNKPLPRDEAIALLRGLQLLQGTGDLGSAMHNHFLETGHRLTFGCCANPTSNSSEVA
jgi:hypothetical protein